MDAPGKAQLKYLRLLVIIVITLTAAFFRLYQIDQLPPGDGYDPAYYGIDALQILRGARPVFFSTNFGREALYSYLVTASVIIWGPTALAVHITSAIIGTLTIPLVYLLAEELFFEETPLLRFWGSTIAALMLAVSYWHLNWSRYGVRAILVPLFASWIILYLWRGLRKQSWHDCVACGIGLGLSMYTYTAARLLPIVVIAAFIYHFIQKRTVLPRDVVNVILIVSISLAVFAPLGYYFLNHPETFAKRIQQVYIFSPSQSTAENLQAFGQHLLNTLLLFGIRGDTEPYSTIPGRPALNIFFAGLFYVGLVSCLVQHKKPKYSLVLTWWVILLIPATISTGGNVAKRVIGTLPAVALLIPIGAVSVWQILRRVTIKLPSNLRQRSKFLYTVLLISGFIYSGIVTYRDYFVIWSSNPNLFTHFEVGISMIGEYINTLTTDEVVYVSPDLPEHPGIRFHSRLRENVYGYNGRVCLVLPAKTATGTTYIITPSKDKHGLAQLQAHYPQGEIVYDGPLNYGEPYFRVYHVPVQSMAYITPTHPVSIQWGSNIQLLGLDLDKNAFLPGDTINLNLYYQEIAPIEEDYTAFVHLLGSHNPNSDNPLWAQNDSEPCHTFYPTSRWKVGEIIKDTIELKIPSDTPHGTYTLATGFYNYWTMERVTVIKGEARDDVAVLGTILVK